MDTALIGSFMSPNAGPVDSWLAEMNYRNIGPFEAHVTITEEHIDELHITDNPVETGANISDHAFKLPVRVIIKGGYSDSGSSLTPAVKDECEITYRYMAYFQSTRTPFDINTGKRLYNNMLIQTLTTITSEETENAFIFTAVCREVILVSVTTTSVPPNGGMKDPSTTSPPSSGGPTNPEPVAPPHLPQGDFPPGGGSNYG